MQALARYLARLGEQDLHALIGPATYLKAHRLLTAGCVGPLSSDSPDAVEATVTEPRAGFPQRVRVGLDPEAPSGLTMRCDCRTGGRCMHALAAVLAVRADASVSEQTWREQLDVIVADVGQAGVPLALAVEVDATACVLVPLRQLSDGAWGTQRAAWTDLVSSWESVVTDLNPTHLECLRSIHRLANRAGAAGIGVSLERLGEYALSALGMANAAGVQLFLGVERCAPLTLEAQPAVPLVDMSVGADALVASPVWGLRGHTYRAQGARCGGASAPWVLLADAGVIAPVLSQVPARRREWWSRARPVRIPRADAGEFSLSWLPRIAEGIGVVSSDGTWVRPDSRRPDLRGTLVRRAGRLTIDWVVAAGDEVVSLEHYLGEDLSVTLREVQAVYSGNESLPAEHRVRPVTALALPEETLPVLRTQVVPAIDALARVSLGVDPDLDARIVAGPVTIDIEIDEGEERDWFNLHVQIRVAGHVVSLEDVVRALADGRDFVPSEDGTWVSTGAPELATLARAIRDARALRPRNDGADAQVSLYQLGIVDHLRDIADVDEGRAWRERVRAFRDTPWQMPADARVSLRGYQRAGAAWCARLFSAGLGGILADDMGLGKTVQVLTAIAGERQARPAAPPVLVVAPTSVASTWVEEARRFYPGLRVRRRAATASKRGDHVSDQARECDILVTSYALVRLEARDYAEVAWGGLVLDEAQAVKNPRSKAYRALKSLSAPWRLAVTGTPVENTIMDLWALFALVAPGLLPGRDAFSARYRVPIERRADALAARELSRRYAPFLCRRTKEQVASDLPQKVEQVISIELDAAHRRVYDAYLARERQHLLGLIEDVDAHRFSILRSLTMLRMLSLDTGLVDGADAAPSEKTRFVVDQVSELAQAGHSVLVFSQFTRYLRRVGDALVSAGVRYAYLDGATRDRDGEIARFRRGEVAVFLMSIKAAGVGITLTEADYVYLLDPWWNPAVEAQAIDRAHRIGQTHKVNVYRLLSADTIESRVADLATHKRALYTQLVDEAAGAPHLSAADLRVLLDLD